MKKKVLPLRICSYAERGLRARAATRRDATRRAHTLCQARRGGPLNVFVPHTFKGSSVVNFDRVPPWSINLERKNTPGGFSLLKSFTLSDLLKFHSTLGCWVQAACTSLRNCIGRCLGRLSRGTNKKENPFEPTGETFFCYLGVLITHMPRGPNLNSDSLLPESGKSGLVVQI